MVGLKPTIALVSRRGIVPISHNQDTAGPMARSVTDAAMLLNAMAGSDPGDPQSADADAHKTDYVKALDPVALKGVRARHAHAACAATMKRPSFGVRRLAMAVLKAQGAEVVEIPAGGLEDITPEMRTILLYDFKQDLNAYLAGTPPTVKTRTLTDLIEFNKTEEHEKLHTQENVRVLRRHHQFRRSRNTRTPWPRPSARPASTASTSCWPTITSASWST